MKSLTAKIISVGTELLLGDIVDTNSAYLSAGLAEIGINLFHRETVGDNHDRLVDVLREALRDADIVITSGGLGATSDDITKECVAEALGLELVLDTHSLDLIRSYYERAGRQMTDNNVKQAYIPKGAIVFDNDYGTAPVLAVKTERGAVVMLPGPPREFCPMFDLKIKPWLRESFSDCTIISRTLRLFGIGEAAAEEKVRHLMDSYTNPTVAPYAKTGEVILRLTAKGSDEAECNALIDKLQCEVEKEVGEYIYGVDISSLEEALSIKLLEKGLTVAFAESCTGGLASKRLVDIPGASKILGMSVVTYSNNAKRTLLGVSCETLEKFGAVSLECAKEMAEGLFSLSGADIAVSVTGVAGPDTDEGKAVGTTFIGISSKLGTRGVTLNLARGKRERAFIRELAVNNMMFEASQEAEKL